KERSGDGLVVKSRNRRIPSLKPNSTKIFTVYLKFSYTLKLTSRIKRSTASEAWKLGWGRRPRYLTTAQNYGISPKIAIE
ncbi:hypothetical protein AVEN_210485-1, partial [Araneus ventricosus]